jgi:2-polyprenyl-6-methoxyphenol hydroxylase-like FAD-dependent oxidoreductase
MSIIDNKGRSFSESVAFLQSESESLRGEEGRLHVAILGGGPAGLIRAIDALVQGHQAIIIEARKNKGSGRENAVLLQTKAVEVLQDYGVYQYLIENKLAYPTGKEGLLSARLCDLETAMKAVIDQLAPGNNRIFYDCRVSAIDTSEEKAGIELQSSSGRIFKVEAIDLIVNAEGGKSSTNALVGIDRIPVLDKVRAIVALFKQTNSSYVKANEFFYGNDGVILAGTFVRTPQQTYLGFGITQKENEKFVALETEIERARGEAPSKKNREVTRLEKQKLNLLNEIAKKAFLNDSPSSEVVFASLLRVPPLQSVSIIEIGADRASRYSLRLTEKTAFIVAGDAAAIVDPSTARGCSTALATTRAFHAFLGLLQKQPEKMEEWLARYQTELETRNFQNHLYSLKIRQQLYGVEDPSAKWLDSATSIVEVDADTGE